MAFHVPVRLLSSDGEAQDMMDMRWDPCQTADCSYLYARLSGPIRGMIVHSACSPEGKRIVKRDGHLKDKKVFAFLRHVAHYSEVRLTREDTFTDLWKLYNMCRCYLLPEAVCGVVYKALLTKIDSGNSVQLLHRLIEEPCCDNLMEYVKQYVISSPLDCIRKAHSLSQEVLQLCTEDELNCSDEQLFTLLMERRHCDSDPVHLVRSCVRMEDVASTRLMQFRGENPGMFDDAFYMACFEQQHNKTGEEKVRVGVLKYGLFPRHLELTRTVETSVSAVDYSIVYFTVNSRVQTYSVTPAFMTCRGVMTVQTHMTTSYLTLVGTLGMQTEPRPYTVEVRVMNFRKLCTKRHTVEVAEGETQFSLEKLLAVQTLATEGYCFDLSKFPVMTAGGTLLVRLSISTA
jgi:hypothetical protein